MPSWALGAGVVVTIAGYLSTDLLLEAWGRRGPAGRRRRLHPRFALACVALAGLGAGLGAGAPVVCLASGIALGMVWPARRLAGPITRTARRLLEGIGIAALAGTALVISIADTGPAAIAALALAGALLTACLVHPATRLVMAGGATVAALLLVVVLGGASEGPASPGLSASIPAASSKSIAAPAAAESGEFERTPPARDPEPTPEPEPPAGAGPVRTSCDAVVHVGDSTSDGLVSPAYLPRDRERIDAQYARYGATRSRMEIEGATSIVESPDGTSAYDAAETVVDNGYGGCWVLALGTNETANVAAGSTIGLRERIDRMMSLFDGRPVLWLTVRTLVGSGPYAAANMEAFNEALLEACDDYPNLRVFDWAAAVKDKWFIEDGIHFTSAGYAARAHRTAKALAEGFPAQGKRSGCVIG